MYVTEQPRKIVNANKNPLKGTAKEERDAQVRKMLRDGVDRREIAQKFGITPERVSQIKTGSGSVRRRPEGTQRDRVLTELRRYADATGRVTVPLPVIIQNTGLDGKAVTGAVFTLQRDAMLTFTRTSKHNHGVGSFKEITLTQRGLVENVGRPPSIGVSKPSEVPVVASGPVDRTHYVGDSCPGGHQALAASINGTKTPGEAAMARSAEVAAIRTPSEDPQDQHEDLKAVLEAPARPIPLETAPQSVAEVAEALFDVEIPVSEPEKTAEAPKTAETPSSAVETAPEPVSEPDPAEKTGFALMYPLLANLRSRETDLAKAAEILERYGLDGAAITALDAAKAKEPLEIEILRYMASHGD